MYHTCIRCCICGENKIIAFIAIFPDCSISDVIGRPFLWTKKYNTNNLIKFMRITKS